MTRVRSKPETTLQAEIVEALQRAGRIVIRVQSGQVKVRGGWMHLAPKGTPDLYVVGWGWIETKTDDGKLSPEQERMHALIGGAGELITVVRSVAEALLAVGK